MDEEDLMELEAARQIMEEQGKEKRGNKASVHAYNKAGLMARAEALDTKFPFTDSYVTKCKPLELDEKDVEDDIKRLVGVQPYQRNLIRRGWVNCLQCNDTLSCTCSGLGD